MDNTPQQTSDEVLLAAMGAGDEAALDVFLHRHQDSLYRFVLRCTGDTSLASEIAQEAFVRAWFAAHSYHSDRGASGRTWLFHIARNLIRDRARRRNPFLRLFDRFREDVGEGVIPFENIPDKKPGPPELAEQRERRELLQKAIVQLPEKLRLPLVLCALEDMPQNEAAQILGISRKAVELRIRRAKDKLRTLLA